MSQNWNAKSECQQFKDLLGEMKRKEKLELITLTLLNWFFFLDFSHFKNDPDRLLFIVGTGIKLENLWYKFDNS